MINKGRHALIQVIFAVLIAANLAPNEAIAGESRSAAYGACMKEAVDSISTEECLTDEADRQERRLVTAFSNALAVAPNKEKLKTQQSAWVKYRNAKCDVDAGAEGYEIRESIACAASMNADRSKELEESAKESGSETAIQEHGDEPTAEEVSALAGDMYRAYINGGLAYMLVTENNCWARVTGLKTIKTAKLCASAAIAGSMVEAAYAQQEGRGPALPYNGVNVRDRIIEKAKLSKEQTDSVRIYAIQSQNDVVGGLFMADMR